MLEDNITWAKQEKRIFLKQSLETRLVALDLSTQSYRPALALIDDLLRELKRLDDKLILTEVHLLESRVYRGIGNFPKAKVRSNVPYDQRRELIRAILLGRTHVGPNSCECHILPSLPPSAA